MKHIFSILLVAFSLASMAQEECAFSREYLITAESGMKMRSLPKAGTEVVTYVMHDSIVTACEESFGTDRFEEIDGHWRKVNYKGKIGYMFDGFLTRIDTPSIAPVDSLTVLTDSLTSDTLKADTTRLSEIVPRDTKPEEPTFVWVRTERDSIAATGRLDQQQIRGLASALRGKDLRMDSLIGFLHKLPTKGSQDSVIAWIEANMPGGVRTAPRRVEQSAQERRTERTPQRERQGPPAMKMQMATEAFNFCGDIGQLDPSINWYGIFPNEVSGGFYIKRVRLEILVSQTKLGNGMEFDIRNDREAVSYFMFGINRSIDTTKNYQLNADRFSVSDGKLFPGQQLMAFAYNNRPSAANVFVSATGRVIEVGACPDIEGYALKINTQGPRDEIIQDITSLFPSLGECGMPEMYWFGDINGDGYPELVFVASEENKNVFTLLMTNTARERGLYELGATWTLEKCR